MSLPLRRFVAGPDVGRDIEIVERKPTTSFSAYVTVMRIQGPGYKSMTSSRPSGGVPYSYASEHFSNDLGNLRFVSRLPYRAMPGAISVMCMEHMHSARAIPLNLQLELRERDCIA